MALPDGHEPEGWLFRILRNIHLNVLRAGRSHPETVSIDELVVEPGFLSERHLNPVELGVIERAELQRIAEVYRTLCVGVSVLPDGVSAPGRYGWSSGYGTTWFNDPNRGRIAIALPQVSDFLFNGGLTEFNELAAQA